MRTVCIYLWSISSRETAGWGVGLLRFESRFHHFIALRPWLSNFTSSHLFQTLTLSGFLPILTLGWQGVVFSCPGFFTERSLCLVFLCSNQTVISMPAGVFIGTLLWYLALCHGPGYQSFHKLVVWFGPCNNPMREVDVVFPCLKEEAEAQQDLMTCHSTLIGTSGPNPCSACAPEIPT